MPLPPAMHACWARCARPLLLAGTLFAGPASAIDLLESYRAALLNDAEYRAAQAARQAGAEALPQARAQLLPTLTAGYARSKLATTSPSYLNQPDNRLEYFSQNKAITLRQPIFRLALLAGYTQARHLVEESEANFEKAEQDLALRVAAAYFAALLAVDRLQHVTTQKASVLAILDAARLAYARGVGTRTDIDEAQARYDMVIADEFAARQEIDYTRHELAMLINAPVDTLNEVDAEVFESRTPEAPDLTEWQTLAAEHNPELKGLRAQQAAAEAQIDKARAGHYPTVDLIAQRSLSSGENVNTPLNNYQTNSAGIQISIPLFAGGYSVSAVRQAVAERDRVSEQLEAARRKLALQVRKAWQDLSEGALRVRALTQAVHSHAQSVDSTRKSLAAGVRSQLDVLDAEQRLTNARSDLTEARLNYLLARIRLPALAGRANGDNVAEINGLLVVN